MFYIIDSERVTCNRSFQTQVQVVKKYLHHGSDKYITKTLSKVYQNSDQFSELFHQQST